MGKRKSIKMSRIDKMFYKVEREKIWISQDRKCYYCKKQLMQHELTLDHVTPLKDTRGHHSFKNCVVACDVCNQKKGSQLNWSPPPKNDWELMIDRWSKKIDERLKKFEYDLIYAGTSKSHGSYTKWKRYWEKRNKWD